MIRTDAVRTILMARSQRLYWLSNSPVAIRRTSAMSAFNRLTRPASLVMP
jgi:hypothetical protein